MSRRYRLSAEARRQIVAIGAFVADDNVDAALKIYDAFEDAFQLLAEESRHRPHARRPHDAS